ncbi:hypothetical protein GW17_00026008 [Ensete ventricosum]|nr:hypothetical protein GW17_00026008 [Ensete ventricosum]RZR98380.1 hypothetical protein BHM03_00027718 [Ensete ventricosum]
MEHLRFRQLPVGTVRVLFMLKHAEIVSNIIKALHKCGYEMFGNEIIYHGHTGQRMTNMIFMGPTYYQRLKHMVKDKIQSKSCGLIDILTKQPIQGRSQSGGLRFGELESDCLVAYGAAHLLKEQLLDQSGAYRVHVCERCGLIAIANLQRSSFEYKEISPDADHLCRGLSEAKVQLEMMSNPSMVK